MVSVPLIKAMGQARAVKERCYQQDGRDLDKRNLAQGSRSRRDGSGFCEGSLCSRQLAQQGILT